MQDARERSSRVLLGQDRRCLLIGMPRVHNQGEPRLSRGGNMYAKAFGLGIARAMLVVEVEPGFAKPDDLGMLSKLDKALHRHLRLMRRFVRMYTNGAEHIVEAIGNRQDAIEVGDVRADRKHRPDTHIAGPCNNGVQLIREIGEIKMAMAVDKHQPVSSPATAATWRGNTGCGAGS